MSHTICNWRDGSGISGDIDEVAEFLKQIEENGAAIVETESYSRPWNHNVVGCGVGHNDAQFAETMRSYAAYLENGAAFNGERWWTDTFIYGSWKYYDVDGSLAANVRQ